MAAIRNMNELNRKSENSLKNAIIIAQSKVYQCINSFIKEYYTEYTPISYKRTYSFYNSLVKSDIRKTKSGYICEIYIDTRKMNYYEHDSKEVVDMINRGFHADTGMNGGLYQTPEDIKGVRVWDESMEEIEKANLIINTFKNYFKANGFVVK